MRGCLQDVVVLGWPPFLGQDYQMTDRDIFSTESRRRTPWTGNNNITESQKFIDSVITAGYDARHPRLADTGEAAFINEFIPSLCPYCGGNAFARYGKTKNGIFRYRCRSCGKTFTPVTGTIFQGHKVSIEEWIDFCLSLFRYQSFQSISKSNRNSYSTTKYWTSKIFLVLEGSQEGTVLEGNVYVDETYYKVRSGDVEMKGGREYRGLSRNQICIAIARDDKCIYLKAVGTGKPTKAKLFAALGGRIRKGSHLIHDEEKAHGVFAERLELTSTTYNSKSLKGLPDALNPLDPINRVCNLLKKFLNAHSGFIRDDIQGYLDLFAFMMNEPRDPYKKVEKLLNCAMRCQKTLSFREKFSQPPI